MTGRRARILMRRAGAALALAAAAGCSLDRVLQIQDPDVSRPGAVTGKAGLPTLLAAATGDFQVAFSGTGGGTGFEGLANLTGLFTDEFAISETFPTRIPIDRRDLSPVNSTLRDIFFNAQRARASAYRADSAFGALAPTDSLYAEALSLEGYSYILLAETYCSGVPVSHFDANGTLVNGGGDPLTTQQLLDTAIARFTLARTVAASSGSTYLENLARVGQARALVFGDAANLPQASTLVSSVPTGFVYNVFSSANTDRQNNGIWEFNWDEARWTQSSREGTNGLAYRGPSGDCSDADPRTPCLDTGGPGFDNRTELFLTLKYPDRNAPTVLASGIEARLIEAEAQLQGGDATTFLATLDALRSSVGLGPLADPGTAQGREDALFSERAFWLYLTSHRLGDLRRLVREYGRDAESVFPTGTYLGRGGGTYGADVNFPIPTEESNNPNFHGCLDRKA